MRYFFALVFSLVLFSCGSIPADELTLDRSLSVEQQAAFVSAADEWCKKAGLCVDVRIGENGGRGHVQAQPDCEGGLDSWTDLSATTGPVVTICGDWGPEQLRIIALHELGHALSGNGEHLTEAGHLMSSPTSPHCPGIDADDVEWALK